MKISIDTKEDSHEEIKKVINMLQNLVGGSGEIFTNDSSASESPGDSVSPIANIFGNTSSVAADPSSSVEISSLETAPSAGSSLTQEKGETSQSTEDLFAELFSEEELKNMEPVKETEDEDEEEELKSKAKSKSKRPEIEFY